MNRNETSGAFALRIGSFPSPASDMRASVLSRTKASIRLDFPDPFGPTTRLNGHSSTDACLRALKLRKAIDAITGRHSPNFRPKQPHEARFEGSLRVRSSSVPKVCRLHREHWAAKNAPQFRKHGQGISHNIMINNALMKPIQRPMRGRPSINAPISRLAHAWRNSLKCRSFRDESEVMSRS